MAVLLKALHIPVTSSITLMEELEARRRLDKAQFQPQRANLITSLSGPRMPR